MQVSRSQKLAGSKMVRIKAGSSNVSLFCVIMSMITGTYLKLSLADYEFFCTCLHIFSDLESTVVPNT